MALITQKTLDDRIELPVALPLTDLEKADWIIVATMKIVYPAKLYFKWLNLMLTTVVGTDTTTMVNSGRPGMAYVGIFKDYNVSTLPDPGSLQNEGTTDDLIIVTGPGTAIRPNTPESTHPTLELSDTSTGGIGTKYTFIAVNNLVNSAVKISVNGQVLVRLNPN